MAKTNETVRRNVAAPVRPATGEDDPAAVEPVNAVLASIRTTVRSLPQERHAELFSDFEGAVKSGNLHYLADTIANWALGGHGYDHAGVIVNQIEPVVPKNADAQTLEIWNSFWPHDGE